MPTLVSNDIQKVEDGTMLLVISSKLVGSQSVLFDEELEVFVRAHEWRWNSTTGKPFTTIDKRRIELHRHLAEMKHRDKAVSNISILPAAICDYRMKNLLIRFS